MPFKEKKGTKYNNPVFFVVTKPERTLFFRFFIASIIKMPNNVYLLITRFLTNWFL